MAIRAWPYSWFNIRIRDGTTAVGFSTFTEVKKIIPFNFILLKRKVLFFAGISGVLRMLAIRRNSGHGNLYLVINVEACVAERLTPRTLDLEVRGSSLRRRVVFLDGELFSTLSLFTRVYKWVPGTYCWGVTLRWTIEVQDVWACGLCAPVPFFFYP